MSEVEKIMEMARDFSNATDTKDAFDAEYSLRKAVEALAAMAALNSTESLRKMLDQINERDPARWEIGFRNIVATLLGPRTDFEIADVVGQVKALVAERDRLSTEIDLVSWSFGETPPDVIAKAKAKAQAQQEPTYKQDLQVEAEVQQPRRVTGQQIAEGLNKALAGAKAQVQQPQERECECCNGTGVIDERLGGYCDSNPAAKCPDCDGAGVWEAKAQVQQEPQEALFLLHTGKFYDGEQDEWEIEADSYNTVSAFCHAHPEQTIGLYAAPVNDKLREAAQAMVKAFQPGKPSEFAYIARDKLREALEAVK